MRSTGFVVLSILVHCLAVASVALNPQRISEPQGAAIEITAGEESQTPGVADAPAEKVTEIQPPAPKVEPATPKALPTPPKKTVAKQVPVQKAPVKESQPENLDPQISEDIPTAAPVAAAVEEQPQAEIVAEETSTAAAPVETPQPAAPAPPAPAEPVAAAAAAGVVGAGVGEGSEELGQGGATKAGAVEYTELKQMNGNRAPFYPLSARREKRQGTVELLYRVTKEGLVTDVQVATSSGSEDLDKEAVRAVAKFRFVPGQEGWTRHPIQFSLKGDTAAAPSRLRTKVGAQDQE